MTVIGWGEINTLFHVIRGSINWYKSSRGKLTSMYQESEKDVHI